VTGAASVPLPRPRASREARLQATLQAPVAEPQTVQR